MRTADWGGMVSADWGGMGTVDWGAIAWPLILK